MTRWHREQAGRVIACAPASHNSSISRSTPGIGARAPPPVSSPGSSSMTQASWRSLAGLQNTRRAAAAMVSAGSDESS